MYAMDFKVIRLYNIDINIFYGYCEYLDIENKIRKE